MKKPIYFLCIPMFFFALLTSCLEPGDPDDNSESEVKNSNKEVPPHRDNFVLTESGWDSVMAMAAVMDNLGVLQGTTTTFTTTYQEQISLGRPEEWAREYALQIAAGQSEADARNKADNAVQVTDISSVEVAYQAARFSRKSEAFARRYAKIYGAQIQAQKSHEWASAYAAQIARGKSEKYATTFAQKKIDGKSTDWAGAYSSAISQGYSPKFATTVADTYEAQIKAGSEKRWARYFSFQIAHGKSPQEAIEFANSKKKKSGQGTNT